MSWRVFEEAAPELASLGFAKLDRKICYLALTNKDGAPRVHPITPFIGEGMLFMFTEPTSPKIGDLRRDSRYAIHCAVGREGPLIEFLVTGDAKYIVGPAQRARAARIAASPIVTDSYALFDFQVAHVLAVEYDQQKQKIVRHWRSD